MACDSPHGTAGNAARVPAEARPVASVREDALMVLFGTWLVIGVFTDAWAHINIVDTLEGFFTPWHALLYSGFAASGAWTFWLAYKRRHLAPSWWSAWPVGYDIGAVGVVIFGAAGVGDMLWHEIFGIEVGIEAALSPTHIMLVIGAALLLTSPVRSLWWGGDIAAQRGRVASALAGLALATTFTSALLMGMSAFASDAPTQLFLATEADHARFGVTSYLITTVLLAVPLLLSHRRRAMPGTATVLVGSVALFIVGTKQFPGAETAGALAAIAAAGVVDVLLVRLDAVRGGQALMRLPIAGGLFSALVWSAHLLGLHLAAGIRWPVELWTGTVVWTTLIGTFLGLLASTPGRLPSIPATTSAESTPAPPAKADASQRYGRRG